VWGWGDGHRKKGMRVNMVDSVFIYENRKMKPVEIVLRRRVGGKMKSDGG
jgi:hypothetical protein